MPKRLSKKPSDPNELMHALGRRLTGTEETAITQAEISRVMAAMGRKGGKNVEARKAAIPPEKRSAIALKAARARWAKEKPHSTA